MESYEERLETLKHEANFLQAVLMFRAQGHQFFPKSINWLRRKRRWSARCRVCGLGAKIDFTYQVSGNALKNTCRQR